MKRLIRRTKQVAGEIIDIYGHIAARNRSAAERVFDEIESTIRFLAEWPGAETRWLSNDPRLADVRMMGLRKYRNYLIFYRVAGDAIEILRVVHGARDLDRVLDDMQIEFDENDSN